MGPEGPQGLAGPEGPAGPPGINTAFAFIGSEPIDISTGADIGVLTGLPEGSFVVMAKARFDMPDDKGEQTVDCTLAVGTTVENSAVRITGRGTATLPFLAPVELVGGGNAVLSCEGPYVSASNVKMTALQVDKLFGLP
jgi:hypothetical protein